MLHQRKHVATQNTFFSNIYIIYVATSLLPKYCKCDVIRLPMKFLSAIVYTMLLAPRPLISGMCDAVVMTTLISSTLRPVGRKGYPSDQRSYAKLISKEEKIYTNTSALAFHFY